MIPPFGQLKKQAVFAAFKPENTAIQSA